MEIRDLVRRIETRLEKVGMTHTEASRRATGSTETIRNWMRAAEKGRKAGGSPKPARELAARALCRHDGHPDDIKFEGRPMWESYLPAADAVLKAIGWREGEMLPVYAMRKVSG